MVNQLREQSEKLKHYDALLLDLDKLTNRVLNELKSYYQEGKDAISEESSLIDVYKKIGITVRSYLKTLDEMLSSVEPEEELGKEVTRENYFSHRINYVINLLFSKIAHDKALIIDYMSYYVKRLRLDHDYKNNNE